MAEGATRREQLRSDFLAQTARISFAELQRFFAAGRLILVGDALDLIDVAVALAEDDKDSFSGWIESGEIAAVSDDQARAWLATSEVLWSVVAQPWVLVQLDRGARAAPG